MNAAHSSSTGAGPDAGSGQVPTTLSRTARIDWLDRFKGMAMILVMVGHMDMFPAVSKWIYSFHVPLFFFASGYLFDAAKFSKFGIWVHARIRTLIVPYFVFGAIGLAGFLIGSRLGVVRNTQFTDTGAFAGMLLGIRDTSPFNGTLWFVSCLAMVELLRILVRSRSFGSGRMEAPFIVAVAGIGAFLLGVLPRRIPLGFDVAIVCVAFHYAGSLYRGLPANAARMMGRWQVLLLLGAVSVLMSQILPEPNLYHARIGNPLVFHAVAMLGILSVLELSKRLPSIPILSHIGSYSLVYLALHQWLVFSITNRVLDRIEIPSMDPVFQFVRAGALLAISIAVLGPLCLVLNRLLPEAIGKKRAAGKTVIPSPAQAGG